jgi:nucleotide-binding universal stress UspA family protein
MQNPLRSEAAAFRFVGVTVVGALVIVGAAKLNTWLGVAVAIVVVAGVAWWYWRQPSARPARLEVRQDAATPHRILVIANETVGGDVLLDEIRRLSAAQPTQVLVVAPALNSRLKHWVSDEDGARAAAEGRVAASVARLAAGGLDVRGEVGDAEPLQAIEDALRTFGADEIVISTHPAGRSHWLEQGLVAEADRRFSPPVTHVIVDLAAENE